MARNRIKVRQHSFSDVDIGKIKRSTFDCGYVYKTTFDSGKLIPFFWFEVLPGDTLKVRSRFLCRLATPIVPFMDNLYIDVQYYFVPNRLVWEHWVNFCGEQEDPDDSIDYLVPTVTIKGGTAGEANVGTLADYFGLPTGLTNDYSVSALPFRAYWLVYNTWFRDENLQDSIKIDKSDTNAVVKEEPSADGFNSTMPAPRGKRFDYFTSALPWPQKGPGVELPLTGNAPLIAYDSVDNDGVPYSSLFPSSTFPSNMNRALYFDDNSANIMGSTAPRSDINAIGNWAYADLSQVGAATINSLRQAFQLQKFYERMARGGSRYIEILRAHFGVISPDARLQRPEYLGGGSTMMYINPIAQTSESLDQGTPQGNLAAFGVAASKQPRFYHSFVEHGIVIGLLSVRADLTYQQQINRYWKRSTREDFAWPTFAHLGEQPIYNYEIFAQGTEDDNGVFGYNERYSEYRYHPSLITGQFRSSYPESLDVWHLSQDFANLPTLNNQFIQDKPPVRRVLAVQDENYPEFILDCKHDVKATRCLPLFGTPGLVDHF